MRARGRLAAAGLLLLLPSLGATGEETAVFRLPTSDLAHYTTRRTVQKNGTPHTEDGQPVMVHGHDLRDVGLYLPAGLRREDLPALFALRTPTSGAFEWRFHLLDTTEIRVKGVCSVTGREVGVDATFASEGRPGDLEHFVLRDGEVHAKVQLDGASGIVRSSNVELAYVREKTEPKKTDKPVRIEETWDFELAGTAALDSPTFPADVAAAIDRGVAHLAKRQKPDGTFEPWSGQEMGTTALCVYTLVSCGVPVSDEGLEKALNLLCATELSRTYEQAVGLMAVERAYTPPDELAAARGTERRRIVRDLPPRRRAWCERTAAALESNCSAPGSWGYPNGGNDLNRADTSNTQYALLGLQAATRLGIAVKEQTWLGALRHFEQARDDEGARATVLILRAGQAITETIAPSVTKVAGFRYRPNERRTWGSMTCAGISSLSIVRDELRRVKRLSAKLDEEIDASILAAWAWLDRHWATDRNPEKTGDDWYYYWLYSLERACVLDAVQRVGGRDWYFEGASELLARQKSDGAWDEAGGVDTTETCFALLFLKRATAPLTPR